MGWTPPAIRHHVPMVKRPLRATAKEESRCGAVPEARDQPQAEHDAARRDIGWSPQVINPPAVGAPRRDVGPSR